MRVESKINVTSIVDIKCSSPKIDKLGKLKESIENGTYMIDLEKTSKIISEKIIHKINNDRLSFLLV